MRCFDQKAVRDAEKLSPNKRFYQYGYLSSETVNKKRDNILVDVAFKTFWNVTLATIIFLLVIMF